MADDQRKTTLNMKRAREDSDKDTDSDSGKRDISLIKAQWGRLISCLPQLKSVDLVESSLSLGRSDSCDVVIYKSKFLPNQLLFISKEHFVITRDTDNNHITYIKDTSKNGTYLNDELIGRNRRVILQDNDCIAIGNKLRVFIFKSMTHVVDENYLPLDLKKKYEPSRLLGKGACGEVRLAYHKYTCQKYAMKKIIKGRNTASQINNINHPNRIKTEIDILKSVLHPLVVNMKEIVETEDEVFIVLEYVQGGELTNRLAKGVNTSEANAKFLFYQIVLAVQYLHEQGITHRDLKPGNVLLCSSDTYTLLKVTDFGLSSVSEGYNMMKTICGTLYYIAPEVLDPRITEYNCQVDIWSMGVILFYMLCKRLPFQSSDRSTLGNMIVTGAYSMDDPAWYEISADAKDLIKRLLTVNPKERISIDEILKHPWIEKDSLMQFKVDNLIKKQLEEVCRDRHKVLVEEVAITGGIKRIKLCNQR